MFISSLLFQPCLSVLLLSSIGRLWRSLGSEVVKLTPINCWETISLFSFMVTNGSRNSSTSLIVT